MPVSRKNEMGFAAGFLALFGALHYGYSLCQGTPLEHLLIDTLTVKPSAGLIDALSPGERVQAVGHRLVSPTVSLNVLRGCEGMEGMLLLASAFLACFTKPFTARLLGTAVSVVLLYALNQLRLCTLYFTARYDRPMFPLIHGYVGPTVIVLGGSLYFVWWISRLPGSNR